MRVIDRERLAVRRKTAAIINLAFLLVPGALVFAAYVIPSSADASSTELPSAFLAALGAIAISPLVVVPWLRKGWARRVPSAGDSADPTTALAGLLTTRMIVELALWEATTVIAFVMVMVGAPLFYLLSAATVTVAGDVSSYPRLSDWEAAADTIDQATHAR